MLGEAPTLKLGCYSCMFSGCTSLTTAPELPATTLKGNCYSSMFEGCTSLTTAPDLPAATLVRSCYYRMFANCSNLNYIKALFTTTPPSTPYDTNQYTHYWVNGVAATGTFVKSSSASWDVIGVHSIPSGWTIETE